MVFKSILVATDFGEAADRALAVGRQLCRALDGHLHVVHVVPDLLATPGEFYVTVEQQSQAEKSARARLDALVSAHDRETLHARPLILISSATANAIVDHAREAGTDLIVMGTHGRGAVAQFFVGSVAEKVIRAAPCPVLVVRSEEQGAITPAFVSVATAN